MPRKKNHKDQLQLDFSKNPDREALLKEFTKRRDELQQALLDFSKATTDLAAAADGGNPETGDMVQDETKETRAAIRRMIGILSRQSGLPFDLLYTAAYHDLYKATGFHAVAEDKGRGTHLDAVEKAGKMADLEGVVTGMLTDERFAPKKS